MNDFLSSAREARPDHLALTDGRRRWTYRQLAREADRLVKPLSRLPEGSIVGLLLPPSPEAVVAIHGVARSGRIVAPLNPRLTAHELAGALAVLRPASVWTTEAELPRVRDAASSTGLALGPTPLPEARLVGVTLQATPRSLDVDGAAAILWTSGTTGRPRGIVLARGALDHVALASRERLRLSPDDRWLASLSPAHVGGLALITRAARLGSALVTRDLAELEEVAEAMDAGEVTHASLVPILLRRLLEIRGTRPAPAGLRCLLVGGGAASPALVERALAAGYPLALTYGLTEATSQVATAPPDLVRRKPGTVGPPLPGVEVRIESDGEILVRGPTISPAALTTDGLISAATDDGWLKTGDLGELDDEGHLWITGRRSDRIVTGGVTVDPVEVESVLAAHPAVREAAVTGIPDPDWGERVAAAVVMSTGEENRLDDVEALCRERLTSAKVPRRLRVVRELPRNPNGKVDRVALRALLT